MSDNLFYLSTGGAPDSSQHTAASSYPESLEYTYTQGPTSFPPGLASPFSPMDPSDAVHAFNPSYMMPSYGVGALDNLSPLSPLSGTTSMYGADPFSSPGSAMALSPDPDTLAPAVSGNPRSFPVHLAPGETYYPQGSAFVHHNHASTTPRRDAVHAGQGTWQLPQSPIGTENDERNAVNEELFCNWEGCCYAKPFNRKEDVRRHINEVHRGIKPYKCHFQGCNAAYSRRYKLNDHISRSHSR